MPNLSEDQFILICTYYGDYFYLPLLLCKCLILAGQAKGYFLSMYLPQGGSNQMPKRDAQHEGCPRGIRRGLVGGC